jgi:hypothetical protein
VVVSINRRPFFLLDSRADKGGYDTGLVDLVQHATADKTAFGIYFACPLRLLWQFRRKN